MATPRYPNRHLLAGGRRPSLVECALALSVIVGLGFVTLRVKTMVPAGWAHPTEATTTEATTVEARTEPPALSVDGAGSKTP